MAIPDHVLNLRKVKAHRINRGLSISELARRLQVSNNALADWEKGRNVMPLDVFQKLCNLYELDYFEVCEILWLNPISLSFIVCFRAACKKEGKTPLQVLFEFIKVYSDLL